MAGATFTKEELWANLEKLGEEQVRERLATKVYGDAGKKRALIVEWLREKDQSRTPEQPDDDDIAGMQ